MVVLTPTETALQMSPVCHNGIEFTNRTIQWLHSGISNASAHMFNIKHDIVVNVTDGESRQARIWDKSVHDC